MDTGRLCFEIAGCWLTFSTGQGGADVRQKTRAVKCAQAAWVAEVH